MDYFDIATNGLPNLSEIENERAKRLAVMILADLEGPPKMLKEHKVELKKLIAKNNGEEYKEPFSGLKTLLNL